MEGITHRVSVPSKCVPSKCQTLPLGWNCFIKYMLTLTVNTENIEKKESPSTMITFYFLKKKIMEQSLGLKV